MSYREFLAQAGRFAPQVTSLATEAVVDKRFIAIRQTRTYLAIGGQIVNLLGGGRKRPGEQLLSERQLGRVWDWRKRLSEGFSAVKAINVLRGRAGAGAFIPANALIDPEAAPSAHFFAENGSFKLRVPHLETITFAREDSCRVELDIRADVTQTVPA